MDAAGYPVTRFPLAPPRRTLTSPRFAKGFAGAVRSARRHARGRRCVAVGTGGYASVPGVIGARLGGAAMLLLSLDRVPGAATRALRPLARRVIEATPVRRGPAEVPVTPRTLLVLGGSQGAASLDRAVPATLAGLPGARGWRVTHRCGADPTVVEAAYAAAGVPATVTPFLPDAAAALASAAVTVTRGGAVTLAEAASYGVAPLVVPHPAVPGDHQRHNAEHHARTHGGTVIPDGPGLPDRLRPALAAALTRPAPAVRTRSGDDAAAEVAGVVRGLLRG